MRYRPDVDGLRAIAVAIVVFYHAGIAPFGGGFVGVDVFFVISGYLITGLIRAELEAGRFSIRRFYERRVRRIFPALFATMGAVALASWFLLPAHEFADLAKSIAAAGASVSNILFALQADYFAAPAESKPLLHTWSLGVEEQFYLVFPALMLLAWRYAPSHLRGLAWATTLLSFAACAIVVPDHPSAGFYLTPFRAWELGLGALAALGAVRAPRSRQGAELLSAAGLAMVLASSFLISAHDSFPGPLALLPCLGALFVIVGGESGPGGPAPVASRVLAWRPVVFVGLVSYSLYLWHWPILVLARTTLVRALTPSEALLAIVLSFLVAVLSWRYVEMPFRRRAGEDGKRELLPVPLRSAGLAIACALLFGLAAAPLQSVLRPEPMAGAAHIRGREDYRDGECFLGEKQHFADWKGATACQIGRSGRPRVLLWGDSFAAHYAGGLDAQAQQMPFAIVQLSAYSCPPVLDASIPWAPSCPEFNSHLEEVLAGDRFEAVIVAARWERYWGRQVNAESLERTLARLQARGLAVVLVGQGPSFGFTDPAAYVARSGNEAIALPAQVVALNRELRALAHVDAFVDPSEALCTAGSCAIRRDGQFLYWDSGHYSRAGSEIAARQLVSALRFATMRRHGDGAHAGGGAGTNAD